MADETLQPTAEKSGLRADDDGTPVPGLLLVWSARRPRFEVFRVARSLTLGRGADASVMVDDARASRRHVEITPTPTGFTVKDLGSQNGTTLDGERVIGEARASGGAVLRIGDTLFLLVDDVRRLRSAACEVTDTAVIGPTLRAVHDEIAATARVGETVHIQGETGAGKEMAARWFHLSGDHARGPFVAVNCATIPPLLAERLLFGAKKGAYSGADADVEGYLTAADGGTLFLDEVIELPLDVQAKLLRVLETREVVPLGASRGRRVSLHLCSATHRQLRGEVGAGRFREDLFFRLGRPAVGIPPLRARKEEIPWLAQSSLARIAPALTAHATLVEQLMVRSWPGNVRELLAELGDAARRAMVGGSRHVRAEHLDAAAGTELCPADVTLDDRADRDSETLRDAERRMLESALDAHQGNIQATAKALGVSRNTLYRKMAKYGLDKGRA